MEEYEEEQRKNRFIETIMSIVAQIINAIRAIFGLGQSREKVINRNVANEIESLKDDLVDESKIGLKKNSAKVIKFDNDLNKAASAMKTIAQKMQAYKAGDQASKLEVVNLITALDPRFSKMMVNANKEQIDFFAQSSIPAIVKKISAKPEIPLAPFGRFSERPELSPKQAAKLMKELSGITVLRHPTPQDDRRESEIMAQLSEKQVDFFCKASYDEMMELKEASLEKAVQTVRSIEKNQFGYSLDEVDLGDEDERQVKFGM